MSTVRNQVAQFKRASSYTPDLSRWSVRGRAAKVLGALVVVLVAVARCVDIDRLSPCSKRNKSLCVFIVTKFK